MIVDRILEETGEANRLFVRDVLSSRFRDAAEELRDFRLLPLVFFILVERAVGLAIDLALSAAAGALFGEDTERKDTSPWTTTRSSR